MSEKQIPLKPEDYLDLWKYFQDKADNIKARMWELAIWHFAAMSGLLGFIAKNFMDFSDTISIVIVTIPGIMLGLAGVLFCIYTLQFLKDYGDHVSSNWSRADRCKTKIKGLDKMIDGALPNASKKTSTSDSNKQKEEDPTKPQSTGDGKSILERIKKIPKKILSKLPEANRLMLLTTGYLMGFLLILVLALI